MGRQKELMLNTIIIGTSIIKTSSPCPCSKLLLLENPQ